MTIDPVLNKRLRGIVRNHEKMRRNGVVRRVGRDGLIRTRPRLVRPHFPLKGAMVVAGLFIAFKSLMFAQVGPDGYALRVDNLRGGTALEQAGAVLMQEEPVTVALGSFLDQNFF